MTDDALRALPSPAQIRERLKDADAKAVAAAIDRSHHSVWRFLTGRTKRPAWDLVQALQTYLDAQQGAGKGGE